MMDVPQGERGYYHAACGKWFKHYATNGEHNRRADSLLDHECIALTPERVAHWRAWQIRDLIAEINARAAELKHGNGRHE